MKKPAPATLLTVYILWTILIFVLCTMPQEKIPNPGIRIPNLDKVVHAGLFFTASLLLIFPLECYRRFSRRKAYAYAIGLSLVYGGLLEILQQRFFHRSGDLVDLFADLAGALIACLCYPSLLRILRLNSENRPPTP